jgi:hypothetical protein
MRQNIVKASTFGPEFMVIKTALKLLKILQCKLCMSSTLIDGAIDVFCDNQLVVTNLTLLARAGTADEA